ncbi:MAG TPA: hypothetical protein VMZ53_20400 [Kofleriaceae bacterium]|nr:hypothetical protein [Kofleriaceae bacterium]
MKSLAVIALLLATTPVLAKPARPGDVGGRRRPPDDQARPHPRPPPPDLDEERVPPPPPPPDPVASGPMIDQRAELTDGGDPVRLVMTSGGKKPGIKLESKNGSLELVTAEGVGTMKTAHGTTLIALEVDDAKEPFRIALFDGKKLTKVQRFARPAKQSNFPFAIAATRTPEGFTVFFQEVETANPNEAHTFMLAVQKDGTAGELKEVQIPWALADAIWNGNGYHLALYYTGEMRGARLSMVSTSADGQPQGHPDWATQPGAISDLHLVETDGKIRAIYRNVDHMYSTDVTKIGQWGQVTAKTSDLGALPTTSLIAITAKGQATKVKTK